VISAGAAPQPRSISPAGRLADLGEFDGKFDVFLPKVNHGSQRKWASPGFKVMTGFSAKIRPEFAEKHNMTLNRVG
jgi:hypothetical protein